MYLNNKIFNFWLIGLFCFELLSEAFNPFMDSDLHTIDWVGPMPSDFVGENVVVMKTAFNERYKCILPMSKESEEEQKKSYSGPTPDELMESLFEQSSCSYRIESYWTYELCHGKHIRQYHENKELNVQKKPKVQEYFLGFARKNKKGDDTEETQEETQPTKIKMKRIDSIELPYYEVNMTDGTVCDLTKQPRQARVLYVCQPDGRGEIYEFKESSTCEYEIVVLTAVLCPNPLFKPKNPPVSKIACHALEGSPVKPKILDRWSKEDKKHIPSEPVIVHETLSDTPDVEGIQNKGEGVTIEGKPSSTVPKKVEDKTLGDITDKEVLRGFLSGSQCLSGGSGWWSHELCFNKKVRQYHEEKLNISYMIKEKDSFEDQNGKIEIILGTWNKQKHLDWITHLPSKRPKPKGQRTSISLLYTDGDVCDITGKKRLVEVRLRCVINPDQPHSVSIYLVEPKTCEYTLGVESPLFCSILDRANDDGIIEDLNV